MRTCPACGVANPDAQKFCGECGARLPVSGVDEEQRKTVTVLFSDVTGSTKLGEQLEPETLRRMLSRFFHAARSVVEAHGGTVEKFIGDAVMAVFGVPVVHEDDAIRALRAALDIMAGLETLNVDLQREYGATLQIRIGVNTGDVVTGTAERLATGDAVNVAARLEQLAPPGEIYVGEVTAQLAQGAATLEELEPAQLKGKAGPTRVFRLRAAVAVERPVRATPMVGRKRQLDMLHGAFSQSVADRACVLFTVLGAAGVGKSRLVAEFLTGLDATVVRGRCLSYGNGIGLFPAVEIVKQLSQAPTGEAVASLLEQDDAVAGPVRVLLGEDLTVSSATEIAWAMRRLLEHAASVRPWVVVLDDLHWGEPALFELVEHLVTLSRDAPILVLVMARPELLERREGWGAGALNASTVLLEPLGPDETAELVDALATSLDADARAKVNAAAGGNPLFAEEMVALVEASGGADVRVPPTIQALLAARLDQLDPEELRTLERGSIEGQSFHRGGVEALGSDDGDLSRRLLGLVRKDLLRPERPVLARDDAYRFRHLLLRDAAYDRLPKSARAELHERFARWLDERGADVAERDHLVGYHLEQAYRYRCGLGPVDDAVRRLGDEAAARLEAAGRRQLVLFDLGGAVDLLDRAASLARRGQPDVALELGAAAAMMMCGRLAEAIERARSVAEAARRAGDDIGALQAEVAHAGFSQHAADGAGDAPDLRTLVDRAIPVFEAAGSDSGLGWAWWGALQLSHNACRFGDGLEAGRKTRMYAERSRDPFLGTYTAHVTAQLVLGPVPYSEVRDLLAEERASMAGYDPWFDVWRADVLSHLGAHEEARALQREALSAMQERGMVLAAAIAAQCAWQIEMAAGDVDGAIAVGLEGCVALDKMGERGWMSTNAAQLAKSLYVAGRDDEAMHWVDRALELGDEDDAVTQATARIVRALLAARRGDVDAALRDVDNVLRITEGMQAPQLQAEAAMDAAAVLSGAGDVAGAREQLRRAVALFRRKGSTVYLSRAEEALAALT